MTLIPKGSLLTYTTGEYSDYLIRGVFRSLSDLNDAELVKEFITEYPSQGKRYHFNENDFLAWLASKSLIEDVDCFEWNLGGYGNVKSDVTRYDRLDQKP